MRFAYRLKQLILGVGDLFSFLLAFWLSLFLRNLHLPTWVEIDRNLTLFLVVFLLWITINFINGLYDLVRVRNDFPSYRRLMEGAVVSLVVGVVFFYLLPSRDITPKTILLLNVVIGYSLSAVWRFVYNLLIGQNKLSTNVLFVGYTNEVNELVNILKNQQAKGYKPVAIVDAEKNLKEIGNDLGVEIYTQVKTIRPAITTHKIQLVIIAPHLKQNEEVLRELYELLFWPVQITDLTGFYEVITGRIPPFTFSESWFLEHLQNRDNPVYNKTREVVDFVAGIIMFVVFVITLPLMAVVIKVTSRGPIFFKQKRVGKYGQEFYLYKFRSMYALSPDGSAETQGAQFAEKKDKRVTSVGLLMRKTRLDELPQAINLLKRDITLIGPRPERPEIVNQLVERMSYYPLRHIVRPGLTGWAVLHQDYTDNLETSLQKLQYDLYYIKNRSFLLDLSILLRTINVVVRLRGQ